MVLPELNYLNTEDNMNNIKLAAAKYDILKLAKDLKARNRVHISKKNFGIPSKADTPKEKKQTGNYPINDRNHARLALAMGSRYLSSDKMKQLRARVHAKYPDIGRDRETQRRVINRIAAKSRRKGIPKKDFRVGGNEKRALSASPFLRELAEAAGAGAGSKVFKAFKKAVPIKAVMADSEGVIKSLEGPVKHNIGDAIMTGTKGEQWVIPKANFNKTYEAVEGMPGMYAKKKIPVSVRQIDKDFSVPVSWQDTPLTGKPGDFRVKYGPNDYGVVDKDIFNETYGHMQ